MIIHHLLNPAVFLADFNYPSATAPKDPGPRQGGGRCAPHGLDPGSGAPPDLLPCHSVPFEASREGWQPWETADNNGLTMIKNS